MKIVVFTQRVDIVESYNEIRDCADQRISKLIYESGYLPIPLPNNVECVKNLLKEIDVSGIVLTGGNSLVKYGGTSSERDETDYFLVDYAVNNKIPLYGFCRGMQSILDYFGEELEQVSGHVATTHNIQGEINESVNSYHNQGCKELENESELVVMAKSYDGVIEAIKHSTLPILGTMWHPERNNKFSMDDINRIKKLLG